MRFGSGPLPARPQTAAGWVVLALVLALVLTGCRPSSDIQAVQQSPFGTIVLDAGHNRLVKLAADEDPGAGAIAFVAVVAYNAVDYEVHRELKKLNTTVLVVNQTIRGKRESSIFRITTSRELQAALDGRFVEIIAPHEIIITMKPGSNSKIVITDAHADEAIYRKADLALYGTTSHIEMVASPQNLALNALHESRADFDTGQNRKVPAKDAEVENRMSDGTPLLITDNRTKVARWLGGGQPSLATCESLPADQWVSVLAQDNPVGSTLWCLHTSQGRYGSLELTSKKVIGAGLNYVLWKKPGDH